MITRCVGLLSIRSRRKSEMRFEICPFFMWLEWTTASWDLRRRDSFEVAVYEASQEMCRTTELSIAESPNCIKLLDTWISWMCTVPWIAAHKKLASSGKWLVSSCLEFMYLLHNTNDSIDRLDHYNCFAKHGICTENASACQTLGLWAINV